MEAAGGGGSSVLVSAGVGGDVSPRGKRGLRMLAVGMCWASRRGGFCRSRTGIEGFSKTNLLAELAEKKRRLCSSVLFA